MAREKMLHNVLRELWIRQHSYDSNAGVDICTALFFALYQSNESNVNTYVKLMPRRHMLSLPVVCTGQLPHHLAPLKEQLKQQTNFDHLVCVCLTL